MRGSLKLLAVAVVTAALAAPAAGFPGGDGPGGGGPPGSAGAGPAWVPLGGDGRNGPRGPSGPNRGPGGVAPPSRHGAPPPPGAQPGFAGHGLGGDDWRRRTRHYWFGGRPIFIPEPSGDYVYGGDDYDDGSDPNGCWVFRKAFDRGGRFLGWVHVDLCEGH